MTAPTTVRRTPMPNAGRAWTMLGLGVSAQTAGTVFVSTPAFLIPLLHTERGLSLTEAGLLAAAPTFGMVLTLVAWGALADRIGERWVIAAGLALTSGAALGAILSQGYLALGLFLLLGGMASASTNSASGRVVVGWFPKARRGLAMGIRQTCQPLGVTIAAITVPLVSASSGVGAALALPCGMTALLAVICAVGIMNPPRAKGAPDAASVRQPNPYRANGFLWRIHTVSALLVVPQFTLSIFGLVWLVTELQWSPLAAGVLVGVSQIVGALGRIVVGVWSDALGSRVRPLRWVAIAAGACMMLLALFDAAGWAAAAIVFVIATTASVVDNGLAFTSVAEMAGRDWAGRALGVQNTGQFLVASVVGPSVGALIALVGYPLAFATTASGGRCRARAQPRRRVGSALAARRVECRSVGEIAPAAPLGLAVTSATAVCGTVVVEGGTSEGDESGECRIEHFRAREPVDDFEWIVSSTLGAGQGE